MRDDTVKTSIIIDSRPGFRQNSLWHLRQLGTRRDFIVKRNIELLSSRINMQCVADVQGLIGRLGNR